MIGGFINCRGFDVAIRPLVQVVAVEGHTLFADGEFPDVGADRLVELIPTHAQVAVGVFRADEARRRLLYASGAGIAHVVLLNAHSHSYLSLSAAADMKHTGGGHFVGI